MNAYSVLIRKDSRTWADLCLIPRTPGQKMFGRFLCGWQNDSYFCDILYLNTSELGMVKVKIKYIDLSGDKNTISRIYEESWKYAYLKIIRYECLNFISKGRWGPVLNIPYWHTLVCVENWKYMESAVFTNQDLSNTMAQERWSLYTFCRSIWKRDMTESRCMLC